VALLPPRPAKVTTDSLLIHIGEDCGNIPRRPRHRFEGHTRHILLYLVFCLLINKDGGLLPDFIYYTCLLGEIPKFVSRGIFPLMLQPGYYRLPIIFYGCRFKDADISWKRKSLSYLCFSTAVLFSEL